MEKILRELAHNRDRLERLRRQGMAYVQERLTCDTVKGRLFRRLRDCRKRQEVRRLPAKPNEPASGWLRDPAAANRLPKLAKAK